MANNKAVTKTKTAPKATKTPAVKTAPRKAKKATLAADLEAGKILAEDKAEPAKGTTTVLPVLAAQEAAKKKAPKAAKKATVPAPHEPTAQEAQEAQARIDAGKVKTADTSFSEFFNNVAPESTDIRTITLDEQKKGAAAAREAAKKKAAKKAPKADAKELKLRLYAKGEFFFGKLAAEKLKGLPYLKVEANGKTVTLTPTKSAKDSQEVKFSHGAPVVRVAKLLAETGWNKATQDLAVEMVGDALRVKIS